MMQGSTTPDKSLLSRVVDITVQIRMSAGLDRRKRPVFRSLRLISARFRGITAALRAAGSSPLLPSKNGIHRDLPLWWRLLLPPLP